MLFKARTYICVVIKVKFYFRLLKSSIWWTSRCSWFLKCDSIRITEQLLLVSANCSDAHGPCQPFKAYGPILESWQQRNVRKCFLFKVLFFEFFYVTHEFHTKIQNISVFGINGLNGRLSPITYMFKYKISIYYWLA